MGAKLLLVPMIACVLALAGCATQPAQGGAKPGAEQAKASGKDGKPKAPVPLARPYTTPADPYPSTYKPPQSPPTLIRGATVLTGTGTKLENADVLIVDGRIAGVVLNDTATT